MTMRKYRDELKAEDKGMALLIDEYYRVAPLLVEKIDRARNQSAFILNYGNHRFQ